MADLPAISLDWREGRFFDRWMLVHFASGLAGGLFNVFLALSPRGVWLLAFAIMVGWEAGEWLLGIREALSNRVLDVVAGALGVALSLALAAVLDREGELIAWGATSTLAVGGSALGWLAYRRRRAAEGGATAQP
jgi:hypothetical protein